MLDFREVRVTYYCRLENGDIKFAYVVDGEEEWKYLKLTTKEIYEEYGFIDESHLVDYLKELGGTEAM